MATQQAEDAVEDLTEGEGERERRRGDCEFGRWLGFGGWLEVCRIGHARSSLAGVDLRDPDY